MYNIDNIYSLHAEITSMCNARCPMCSRYTLDGFLQPDLEETHLDTEIYLKLINSLPSLKSVYFSGVYGDPCMHPGLIDICKETISKNIDVKIDTNAGYRKDDFWRELASTGCYVNFAIDGLEDTNKIYRKSVEWSKVEKNVRAFSEAGGRGCWNFIVFKHNEHQVEQAKSFASELGLDFRVKITQKFRRAKVWNVMINGSKAYEIKPPENAKYRHPNISTRSYSIDYSSVNPSDIDNIEIDCKALKNKEVFLNHKGLLLPCCYVGSVHGQSPASKQLSSLDLTKYSIVEHSVIEVIENLSEVKKSWSEKYETGKLIMCAQTCGSNKRQHTQYE